MKEINVFDSLPGTGKTQFIANYMKDRVHDYNFCYITPFLDEITRLIDKNKKTGKDGILKGLFNQPMHKGKGKLYNIKKMISNYENICSTHSLFSQVDEELIELLKHNKYILVLDEVMDVIEQLPMKRDDIQVYLDNGWFVVDNKTSFVTYNGPEEYNGDFKHIVDVVRKGKVILDNELRLLFWKFPAEIFDCFEEVFILTYMFNGQIMKYYFDVNTNTNYKLNSVVGEYPNFELIDYNPNQHLELDLRINILDNHKINNIGMKRTDLSYNWYIKHSKKKLLFKQLNNNLKNFYTNISKSNANDFLWTSFKNHKERFDRRFNSSFLACTARATNDYSHKNDLAYLVNRFINPVIYKYFYNRDVKVDQDAFALSEMLQWTFRSAIRNREEINLYCPSKRSRELLINWLGK
jgi:hypothetical protein